MTSDYRPRPLASHGSWTVILPVHGEPKLLSSGWAVGYTEAHKETKLEAMQYAIARTNTELASLKNRFEVLSEMVFEEQNRLEVEKTNEEE